MFGPGPSSGLTIQSYEFLGAETRRGTFSEISGYTWDVVNHSKGKFVRGSVITRVSAIGFEGLFGRVTFHDVM